MKFTSLFLTGIAALIAGACTSPADPYSSWAVYHGTREGIKYSSLTQIDTTNVNQLQIAWTYHTGDADTLGSQIQCNPIVIDGVLYGVGPQMRLFAIDAATGKEKWIFDSKTYDEKKLNRVAYHILINSRGVAYWTDGKEDKRIFFTAGSFTYAINASTGMPIPSFGNNGSIDLHEGLDRDVQHLFVVNTSPGIIYKDLIILGTRVDEGLPSAPGHIRAYDVRTGEQRWIFHTIPHPGEYGYDTWENKEAYQFIGGANVWSGFTLDEKRGILFAPTGSAAYDFYGGNRKGANLFANSLLALDAATGKYIWHHQLVHHDVWDKDLPTPPALVTLSVNGKRIDAVAQSTKNGMIYVFDRENGKPVFPIDEIPVDTLTDLPGEKLWPTQPIPQRPAPFARQVLRDHDVNPYVDDSTRQDLLRKMKSYRHEHMYTPPGKIPSLVFPGYDGGGEWGGPAFDPQKGMMYVNSNEMAWIMEMVENKVPVRKKETRFQAGVRLYSTHCAACHGTDRKGLANNPTLLNLSSRYDSNSLTTLMNSGLRMMPAFGHLRKEDKDAIAAYLLDVKSDQARVYDPPPFDSLNYVPYKLAGYKKFLTPDGYPAISPPWGTLSAINLNSGELVWQQSLGEYPELKAKGIPPTGTENYGGPVVTAGGLVFIGATLDGKFRAFNKTNGKLLWSVDLPAAAFATPAVYELNGKQYIVIACGGGKLKTKSGDAYVAFTLSK